MIIVDDQTFSRIEGTANRKMLDGCQIRIPDALRLIALKLHATRDTARRNTETDWQDVVSLLRLTNQNLEDPELRTIISQYGGPERSPRSRDVSTTRDDPGLLRLPIPPEALREWTEQEIKPDVMIAAMESMMRTAMSEPNFEERRLERKTLAKFKY